MDKSMLYAYEVYREKSFTQAAKKLYISQPALSLAIHKLESELGILIFDRSTSPVSLTEEGRVYIQTAGQILNLTQQLDNFLADRSQLSSGKITVGAPHLFFMSLIPSIISRFSAEHQSVDFNLLEGDTVQLRDMLLNDDLDLIIDTNEYEPALLVQHELRTENILLAAPSTFSACHKSALKGCPGLTLQDIRRDIHTRRETPCVDLSLFKNEPFLLQRQGQDMHERAFALCRNAGFTPRCNIHLNQLITSLELTRQNRGLTFISDTSLMSVADGSNLLFFRLPGTDSSRKLYISYRKNRYVSSAMQKFIEYALSTPGYGGDRT